MKNLRNRSLILAVFILGLSLGAIIAIQAYKHIAGSPLDQLYNLYNAKGVSQEELLHVNSERQIDSTLFKDPMLDRWKQYYEKILFEDIQLRKLAASIVAKCAPSDKECKATGIYSYVVKNFNYYNDPRFGDFIQSVNETLEIKGGDCEDLAILLNSLLENMGLKTYLVVTEDHMYSLVCDLNRERLSFFTGNKSIVIKGYNVSNEVCVVIDASAGVTSYVGNEPYKGADKTAIDSVTNKYFKLS